MSIDRAHHCPVGNILPFLAFASALFRCLFSNRLLEAPSCVSGFDMSKGSSQANQVQYTKVKYKSRGGNKIWIFKPQVNFDVIPTYKHGGKWFFEFGGHLNPPHLRWSFRFFGDFRPFQRNLYIFINAGLEPKLFEIKSSTQQQSCKAHKIGQFCHQDRPSNCLGWKVRDRAITAFQLAPKW